ncbi:MAG: hypothetical protein Q9227_001372 [Pyrenula ochraceoflavens]
MDFSSLKNSLRIRSGRQSSSQNKRFPTKDSVYVPREQFYVHDERDQLVSPRPTRKKSVAGPSTGTREQGKKTRFAKEGEVDEAVGKEGEGQGGKKKGLKEKADQVVKGVLKNGSSGKLGGEDPAEPSPESKEEQKESHEASQQSDQNREDPATLISPPPEVDPEYNQKPLPDPSTAMADSAMVTPEAHPSSSSEPDYSLHPPKFSQNPQPQPPSSPVSIEKLSSLLHSSGYLQTLTTTPHLLSNFTTFLSRYRPDLLPLIPLYLETRKVLNAISYANAVASALPPSSTSDSHSPAAELSQHFRATADDAFNKLLTEALPAFVTYSLVKSSTAILTAEITATSTPLTTDLVGGLSEVFCITDPTQQDNPIIYATAEFYRLTQYSRDEVIGHNCRFLQGRATESSSVDRLRSGIREGREVNEMLVNYRKGDKGKGFINLLMLAPLHDESGVLRYYLGAQVDASRLVEGGRGVVGFERYLVRREVEEARGREREKRKGEGNEKDEALEKLRDLSRTFDLEESAVVRSHSRSNSVDRAEGRERSMSNSTERQRRVLKDDENEDGEGHSDEDEESESRNEKNAFAGNLAQDRRSGTLPGIYQKYLLIRPYPSLRIVFASQAVRKIAQLQQRPFLSHVAAPPGTLTGLKESLETGTPVTGKVVLMEKGGRRDGTATGRWGKKGDDEPSRFGRVCWISATPLLDGADRVGVWMVVLVDRPGGGQRLERIVGSGVGKGAVGERRQEQEKEQDLPIKPKKIETFEGNSQPPNAVLESQLNGGHSTKPAEQNTGRHAKHHPADSGYGEDIAGLRPPQPSTKEEEQERNNHRHDQPDHESFPNHDRLAAPPPPSSSTSTARSPEEIFSEPEDANASIGATDLKHADHAAALPPQEPKNASPNGSTPQTPEKYPPSSPHQDINNPDERTPTRPTYIADQHSHSNVSSFSTHDIGGREAPSPPPAAQGRPSTSRPGQGRASVFGMDYLSARPRGGDAAEEKGRLGVSPAESDWPCRSPYSVD